MKALLTKSEKEKLFEQFEKSGKTHAQFAKENGYNVKTFSKWIYEWHHQNKTAAGGENKFVEIKTASLNTEKQIQIHKSGMEIMIPGDFDFNQMKNLFTVLVEL